MLAVAMAVLIVGGLSWFAAVAAIQRAGARKELQLVQSRLDRSALSISALAEERDALKAELSDMQRRGSGFVPNGKGVTVELGGSVGLIEIHDVHLRHAYGFSDLVGIAVNTSDRDLAYVQLGCTLLDGKGRVLANVIDNRETWAAGATWGFTCSAEVDATGGIVRVDALE
jgi:hypothetical protein